MLDIHTHILPEMDDGSSAVEESLEMLRAEWSQGVRTVVLTPHFYPDKEAPGEFLSRRRIAVDRLAGAASGAAMPRLIPGAEIAFFRGISRSEGIEQMCIGETRAILVEMPFCEWNDHMLRELFCLREQRGLQPVIAHVERYLDFQPRGTVSELCESGMLLQANASFFLERSTARTALRMVRKQQIHLLGSDCHNMRSRKPNIGAAFARIEEKLGEGALDYLSYMQDLVLEVQ